MSKMKQIAALTAMLVGVIMYASPAKSAVCFLPDDDGNCGGGDIEISDGSDDNKPEEKCDGFTISAAEYEKKKDCFNFTSCTKSKTKEIVYKQESKKADTTWSNGVCCTGGTTYDSSEGKCCPAGGCVHECDAPREWSSTLRSCECPAGREENTNKECCPVGEHADGAICCPDKKRNIGGKCVCDADYISDGNGGCEKLELKPIPTTITIAFRDETYGSENLKADMNNVSEYGDYYKTIKFTSNASDNSSHTVELRTYPGVTCTTRNTTPTTVIVKENTPTVYKSACGRSTGLLFASHGSVIETYIDGKLVATHYISSPFKHEFTSTLDGKSVTSGNYIIRYSAATCADLGYLSALGKCSGTKSQIVGLSGSDGACYVCKQSGGGSDSTCEPGTATIEYAYYYYYLPSREKPYLTIIPYGSVIFTPTITFTNMYTKDKITVDPFREKTTLNIKQDLAGNKDSYTCSAFFGDSAHVSTGDGLIAPDGPTMDIENGKDNIDGTSSTKWICGYKLMTKANYTKATGRYKGGPLYVENDDGKYYYYGDDTFKNVRLLGSIGCAGEYVLVYGCKK